MKINVTEQTSTFAVPLNKLKGHLMDNIDLKWETSHGEFNLDLQTINWIMDNAKVSMYNDNRSYIYNKAFAKYWDMDPKRNIQPISTYPADIDQDGIDRINNKLFSKVFEFDVFIKIKSYSILFKIN